MRFKRRPAPGTEAELRELARIRAHREYRTDLRDPRVIGPRGESMGIPGRQVPVKAARRPLFARLLLTARFTRRPGEATGWALPTRFSGERA